MLELNKLHLCFYTYLKLFEDVYFSWYTGVWGGVPSGIDVIIIYKMTFSYFLGFRSLKGKNGILISNIGTVAFFATVDFYFLTPHQMKISCRWYFRYTRSKREVNFVSISGILKEFSKVFTNSMPDIRLFPEVTYYRSS